MNIKKHIPNSLTLLNLLSGCLALIYLFIGRVELIPYLVVLSLVADFLDGLVARALGVSSPIGKELDSLADMVSFGVLPGMLMVYLACKAYYPEQDFSFIASLQASKDLKSEIFIFFPLIITLFSALRLAKFNIATDQSTEFKGLATPAATILVIGLFIVSNQEISTSFLMIDNSYTLLIISGLLAFLLVSNIPMFSFKLSGFSFKENIFQLILVVSSLILIVFFKFKALPLIILVYILLNLIKITIKNRI